jgi:hypothetical protein
MAAGWLVGSLSILVDWRLVDWRLAVELIRAVDRLAVELIRALDRLALDCD